MESFPQRVCYVMVEIPTHISKSPRYLSLYFHRSTKTREYPQVLQPFTAQLFSAQLVFREEASVWSENSKVEWSFETQTRLTRN